MAATAGARRWLAPAIGAGALGLAAVAILAWVFQGDSSADAITSGETARAVGDRLIVTITESGEIDAKRSTNVTCEVEGQSTIIWVIEEGTLVNKGDRLMELDSADLQERVQTQEMGYKTAKAAFEKADKAYLIAESTRQSLMSAAGLTVKFALLDLRKYLGADLADRLIASEGKMDFNTLVKDPNLGGEALQAKRKLESDISLVTEELKRAVSKAEWTRTLKEKGYVTGSELEADELAAKRQQVLLDQAGTALDLFLNYEFPKAAEKAYTDWLEDKREYDRVDTRTQSELDSARASRDNMSEALGLEEKRFKKVQDQLAKTTIVAPQPGMVVYDTGGGRFGQQVVVEAGATVRHQQNLFKLPDMSEMNVKTKLHESVVKQASEGAPAFVTIDAYPKDRLTGRITKIAIMPDRGQMWLNPGLKTYVTEVTLDSSPPGLKPGMNAQVEILVASRENTLQVPVSAVFVDKGFQVVYLRTPSGLETRRIEVGLSNDRAVEIVSGLKEGEDVYLYKPPGAPELVVSAEEMKRVNGRPEWDEAALEAAKGANPPAGPGPKALTPEQIKTLRDQGEKMAPAEREKALKQSREDTGDAVPDAVPPRPPRLKAREDTGAEGPGPAERRPRPAGPADEEPRPKARPRP